MISKSDYLAGTQCKKLLWYKKNDPNAFPTPDETALFRFQQGDIVEEYANELFPHAFRIEGEDIVQKTKGLLGKKVPLLQSAFEYNATFCIVDILVPLENGWKIIEVKSTASVKDHHLTDIAFQKYCLEGAGLKVKKCSIMHINTKYARKEEIDSKKLFVEVDVTNQIADIMIEPELLIKMISGKCPIVNIGQYCKTPYCCDLKDMCWKFLPKDNVLTLQRIGSKGFKYVEEGKYEIKEINPEEFSPKQQIQINSVIKGLIKSSVL